MKADTPRFTLSPELIEQAKREKARLEQEVTDAQQKLAAIKELLRAATLFTDELDADTAAEVAEKLEEIQETEAPDPSNIMASIAYIANESPKAMTKAEMKEKLIEAGVPRNRLGSYFYVAIDRLKKKDRITVLDDGRIWRAPKN